MGLRPETGTYHAQPPTHLIHRPLLRVFHDISSESLDQEIGIPASGRIWLFGKYVVAPDGPGGCCCDHSRKPYIHDVPDELSAILVCWYSGGGKSYPGRGSRDRQPGSTEWHDIMWGSGRYLGIHCAIEGSWHFESCESFGNNNVALVPVVRNPPCFIDLARRGGNRHMDNVVAYQVSSANPFVTSDIVGLVQSPQASIPSHGAAPPRIRVLPAR